MILTEYSINDCVAAFNRRSPKPRDRRTVQRWLKQKGIAGFGSSRHNWYFPSRQIEAALDEDFRAGPAKPRSSALVGAEGASRKAARRNRPARSIKRGTRNGERGMERRAA